MKRIIYTILSIAALLSPQYASARQPEKGYRGFLEWNNSTRTNTLAPGWSYNEFYTGVSTSHGYQINSMFFAGAGLDFERCQEYDENMLALFVQGRADFKFGKFTPFGDMRLGFNFTQGGGIYFSPSIGYRFNWGRKVGINIGAGLTLQGYTIERVEIVTTPEGYEIGKPIGKYHHSNAYFSFRLGFDF